MSLSEKYDLSKGKVLVLVFNHVLFDDTKLDRYGAEVDEALIKDVFESYYRSKCEVFLNCTKREVDQALIKIESRPDLPEYCCVITIVMSHGMINGDILTKDYQFYNFNRDIVDRISSINLLEGKPKLFIGQFCRDYMSGTVAKEEAQPIQHLDSGTIYSAYWGSSSGRYEEKGTPFIQHFFREMLHAAPNTEIQIVHENVNRELKRAAPLEHNFKMSLFMDELRLENIKPPADDYVRFKREWKEMEKKVEQHMKAKKQRK